MLVDKAFKEIDERKKMVMDWWSDEAVALSLKAKFPKFFDDYSISIHWEQNYWKGIFLSLHHVKSMDDLKPIFQFLGRHGYLHTGKPDIYEEIHRVTWTFGNLKILVFFNDEDAQCKFLKIGTKTIDEYKFVCPDSPNL